MIIEGYNNEWLRVFNIIELIIFNKLNGLVLWIEYVGSILILSFLVKLIIDIDVVIEFMDCLL